MRTYTDPETVDVAAGERFIVALSGNAVGGYEWQVADSGDAELLAADIEPGAAGLPGEAGTARFSFAASGPGRTTLAFALKRRWEDEALRTHRVEVLVRGAPYPPGG